MDFPQLQESCCLLPVCRRGLALTLSNQFENKIEELNDLGMAAYKFAVALVVED